MDFFHKILYFLYIGQKASTIDLSAFFFQGLKTHMLAWIFTTVLYYKIFH